MSDPKDDQTTEERRKLRIKLRSIVEDLNKDEEDLVRPESEELTERLSKASQIFKEVKTPREGVIESKAVLTITTLGKRKAQNLNTDFVVFNPTEFVQKILTYAGAAIEGTDGMHHRLTKENWIQLGSATQPFLKKSPPFKCMFGTFERGEIVRAPPKDKNKALKKKDNVLDADKTVPKEVKQGEVDALESTTKEVEERILKTLWSVYEEVDRRPICYFEFVTNPESYTETVENMFHTSFLIKSGHARIFLDDDRLPVIEPVEIDEGDNPINNGAIEAHQMIQSLSIKDWQDIVSTFEIREPTIPPRGD